MNQKEDLKLLVTGIIAIILGLYLFVLGFPLSLLGILLWVVGALSIWRSHAWARIVI